MSFKTFSFVFICGVLIPNFGVFGNSIGCGQPLITQDQWTSGSYITKGAFPWNAALFKRNGEVFCSGTLISTNEVVTAAGCIKPKYSESSFQPSDIVVVLGAQNLQNVFEVGRTAVLVKNIRIHNDWNVQTDSFDADIAVLELANEISFGNFIQPICLIEADSDVGSLTNASIVGFKSTTNGIENVPRILKTPIVNFEKCSDEEGYRGLLSNRMLCGGLADGTGPCLGDGGTGMIVAKNGVNYLRGITSATLVNAQGCNNNAYSVFTDVTKFRDWIKGI